MQYIYHLHLDKIEKLKWFNFHFPNCLLFCRNLKLEYVDQYLIHWPVSMKPGPIRSPTPEDLLPLDIKSVWTAMEECQTLGLTKSIGVSNFTCKKLGDLLAFAKIPPTVNQVSF